MMLASFLLLLAGANGVGAFVPQNHRSSSVVVPSSTGFSTTALSAMTYDDIVSRVDHYEVTVPKPLGIVFGENPDPYFGLGVDDVAEGYNGGKAGLRVGDQLLAVNEEVVVGKDFDSVMELLQDEPNALSLVMYRGPASQLFTVLANQLDEGESIYEEEDDDEEEEEVIMDENYESPVRVEVVEEKPLTAGDVFKAFGKIGSMVGESVADAMKDDDKPADGSPPPPKKNTGFFGMGGDTVQLDGNEARGYRKEKIEPDEF